MFHMDYYVLQYHDGYYYFYIIVDILNVRIVTINVHLTNVLLQGKKVNFMDVYTFLCSINNRDRGTMIP